MVSASKRPVDEKPDPQARFQHDLKPQGQAKPQQNGKELPRAPVIFSDWASI